MPNKTKNNLFKSYGKMLSREFKGYGLVGLLKDIMAGLTVAAVALPLALAFGAASVGEEYIAIGVAAGLITAIIAGVVTGLLGGASYQISGPTGAMTVILGGLAAGEYGLQGVMIAGFMAGCILLLAGLLHVGKLINFIPRPVVAGFTSGIAIVIALGQLGNFFGVQLVGETTLDKLIYFFTDKLGEIDLATVICSLAVVIIMVVYPKKIARYVPGSLAAIILITAVVRIAKVDIKLIGSIPASLIGEVRLDLGSVDGKMLVSLIAPAFTIAALGMIESLLCGTCAANMKKEKFDSNIELIAQGVGNMIVPLFGGVPSTAAMARTGVAIKSGGQTRLTSLFQSLFLILCMYLLSSIIGVVPYAALAGVLAVTAWRMNEWETIVGYFKHKNWDAIALFLITMISTVLLDLTYAIIIGVVCAFVPLFFRLANKRIPLKQLRAHVDVQIQDTAANVMVTGVMYFGNEKEVRKSIDEINGAYEKLTVDLSGVNYIDVSAVAQLREIYKDCSVGGKQVRFAVTDDRIMRVIEHCGLHAEAKDAFIEPAVDYEVDESMIA